MSGKVLIRGVVFNNILAINADFDRTRRSTVEMQLSDQVLDKVMVGIAVVADAPAFVVRACLKVLLSSV